MPVLLCVHFPVVVLIGQSTMAWSFKILKGLIYRQGPRRYWQNGSSFKNKWGLGENPVTVSLRAKARNLAERVLQGSPLSQPIGHEPGEGNQHRCCLVSQSSANASRRFACRTLRAWGLTGEERTTEGEAKALQLANLQPHSKEESWGFLFWENDHMKHYPCSRKMEWVSWRGTKAD